MYSIKVSITTDEYCYFSSDEGIIILQNSYNINETNSLQTILLWKLEQAYNRLLNKYSKSLNLCFFFYLFNPILNPLVCKFLLRIIINDQANKLTVFFGS